MEARAAVGHLYSVKATIHQLKTKRLRNSPHFERLLLLLSHIHLAATLTATLLFFELVISGAPMMHATGFISRALLPIGLLGVVNIPFLFWIRAAGVRRFHFREHEARQDAALLLSAQTGLLERTPDIHDEMRALIHAIDAADVWDRPAARSTAREWIVKNRSHLDEAAWEYLQEHVGYLLPSE